MCKHGKCRSQCNAYNEIADVFERGGIEHYIIPFGLCFPGDSACDGNDNLLAYETADVEQQYDTRNHSNPMYDIDIVG